MFDLKILLRIKKIYGLNLSVFSILVWNKTFLVWATKVEKSHEDNQ